MNSAHVPSRQSLVRITLGAILAGSLVACGGTSTNRPAAAASSAHSSTSGRPRSIAPPTSSATSAGTDPACDLVTKAEVSVAVGYPIVKSTGVNSALVGTDICTFQGAEDGKVFYVTIFNTPAAQRLPLEIEAGSEHVAGLGDSAFWASSAGFFVRKGGRMLGLQDLSMNAGRDALAALAAQAVPKM